MPDVQLDDLGKGDQDRSRLEIKAVGGEDLKAQILRQDGGRVEVDLTFTATACPCMAFIHFDIQDRLQREPGVDEVVVNEVWTPAWTKARITPEGRETLRTFGVSM